MAAPGPGRAHRAGLLAASLAFFRGELPCVQGPLSLRGVPVSPVGGAVTAIRRPIALIRVALAGIGELVALVREPIALVGSGDTVRISLIG